MSLTHLGCRLGDVSRSIQIRNVPDGVHRTLRARAAAAGLSLSEYLLAEVTRVAQRPTVADVLARAAERSGGTRAEKIVSAVRSGRDRA
jgi:plasmid stability protein